MLPDYLGPDLKVVFAGTSVATTSASIGHYYAGATNKFWQLLRYAELTGGELLSSERDALVLKYGIGLTDIVKSRAASSDSLLRSPDFDCAGFLAKIDRYRPRIVAFNGKEAARRVFRYIGAGRPDLGLATVQMGDSSVFVLPSSSGSSADPKHFAPKTDKAGWWRDLGSCLRSAS